VTAIIGDGPAPVAGTFLVNEAGIVFGVSVAGFELLGPQGPSPSP
jgi:hypothetical protein